MGGPEYARYIQLFHSLCRGSWALSRAQAEPTFSRARLPREDIDAVWALCDTDGDGYLARNEFAVALHIAAARYKGAAMPQQLPPSGLLPPEAAGEQQQQRQRPPPPPPPPPPPSYQEQHQQPQQPQHQQPPSGYEDYSRPAGYDDEDSSLPKKGRRLSVAGAASAIKFGHKRGSKTAPPPPPPPPPREHWAPPNPSGGATGGGGGGDAEHVHRSGLLSANKSKRWCVLSGGKLDVFDKKADQTKPPKMSLDLRADVSKVARSDLKSFKLELHPGSRHAKAAKSAGGSASLLFSSDDNTEISKWVNDLTKVVSGLHGGH
mmetsp:Transcript_1074/g.3753  ORF Transcript_1074/g.3753 Transcript_1074/m.3753 type:complete len:319 (+) Transcript_1074:691-1647(+)